MPPEERNNKRPLHEKLLPRFKKTFQESDNTGEETTFVENLCHVLIQESCRENASDIHLDPSLAGQYVLRLRVDGALLDTFYLDKSWADRLMNHFKVMAKMNPVPARGPMEGWVEYILEDEHFNSRISCTPTISGDKMSIRLFDPSRLQSDLQHLGLKEDQTKTIRNWIDDIRGMFLVVGSIGSGKTTTLYTLLNELLSRPKSIVTIEDPVEYPVAGLTQIQVSRESDLDFVSALRSVARLDPDYIMVGELRDRASARLAVSAASFGKVILGTMHSRDVAGAVSTLRNFALEDFEIASALQMVVSQRLVRTLCPECRKKKPVDEADRAWANKLGWSIPDELWYPEGCDQCKGIGFDGRTGIFEIWQLDPESRNLLLEGRDEFTIRSAIEESDGHSLLNTAYEMVVSGDTSLDEIRVTGGLTA